MAAFECIHDMPDPVSTLRTMRRIAADDGIVVVMDEKVSEAFHPGADEVEQLMYGFSNFICLPDGMAHLHSAGTGTVMRPDTLRTYAREAGFTDIEVLPIEADTWRFYRLVSSRWLGEPGCLSPSASGCLPNASMHPRRP